jgi:hypothetical protein
VTSMGFAYDREINACLQRLIEPEGRATFKNIVGTLRSGRPIMKRRGASNHPMEVSCGRY